jgi:hypothetical protein
VTRNLSGAGAKNWPAGTPYQVRGVAGDGWIELNAFNTPRMSIFSQGSAYNNSTRIDPDRAPGRDAERLERDRVLCRRRDELLSMGRNEFQGCWRGLSDRRQRDHARQRAVAYDASGSLKFNRDGAFGVGAANVFGLVVAEQRRRVSRSCPRKLRRSRRIARRGFRESLASISRQRVGRLVRRLAHLRQRRHRSGSDQRSAFLTSRSLRTQFQRRRGCLSEAAAFVSAIGRVST